MEHSKSFGEWLTAYRQSLHLQRAELAARIGCAAVTLRKIETDERRPSRQMSEQLAEQLAIAPGQREIFVRVARGELPVDRLPLPKSTSTAPTNLPHPTTLFTGRAREIEEIKTILLRPDVRLLSLTGAPGVGKTRLALEAATQLQDAFADSVYLVTLAPLNEPGLVLVAIAHALQIGTSGRQPLAERLSHHLRTRHLLLVLDNFEHVLAAAPQLNQLLIASPYLKLLVTSQIALELSGEHRLTVLPLAVPPALENRRPWLTPTEIRERYPAVDLFIQRARAVKSSLNLNEATLSAIGEICRKLDGLPLAIEFVAARTAFFTPQELLVQLINRVPLKIGGARDLPAHHLTLWHALDWSYSLLSKNDQQLFRRLSIFAGGCTLEAVQAVCNNAEEVGNEVIGGITTLLTNSLLQHQEDIDGSSRFEMLETIREYALSQLAASGEAEIVRQRHAAYYLGLAEAAERAWDGPTEWDWLRRLVSVRDNLRATLRWTFETTNTGMALRFNAALFMFWTTCSVLSEARSWVEAALALPLPDNAPELVGVRAKVLNVAGYVATEVSDYRQAYSYFEQGLALYRTLGDKRGIAWSIRSCAFVHMSRNNSEAAEELLNESLKLCGASGDEWGLAWSLYALAFLKLAQSDLIQARQALEEALIHLRQQNMAFGVFRTLLALGYTHFEQGDVDGAEALFHEALVLNRETPLLTVITAGLEGLALVSASREQPLGAARLWGAAEAMREMTGERRGYVYQRTYDRMLAIARSQVVPAVWEREWASGRELTAGQAVAEALRKGAIAG